MSIIFDIYLGFRSHQEEEKGSRKMHNTSDVYISGGKGKKIKDHAHDKYSDSDVGFEIKVGDGSRGDMQTMERGASGSDLLTGPNSTTISPQTSLPTHTQTPRNTGTISKIMKEKDFQLFPPAQDQPNKQLVPQSLDRYAYRGK